MVCTSSCVQAGKGQNTDGIRLRPTLPGGGMQEILLTSAHMSGNAAIQGASVS